MGTRGRGVLLLLFLTRTGLLALGPQDLSTAEPGPTLHLRFDARTWTLAWTCVDNVTVLDCTMFHREDGPVIDRPRKNQCRCEFKDYTLHKGALFTVKASLGSQQFEETLEYTNPGAEGTAAANFSCFILDADFMNCTWTRGQRASLGVQYFLHIREVGEDTEVECPRYVEDDRGTHVGCHIHPLDASYSDIYFLVNGTSPEAKTPFFDAFLTRREMQTYRPPTNISATCNHSHCLLRWARPSTQKHMSPREQDHEVDIRPKGSPDSGHRENMVIVSGDAGDKFHFPISPRTSYTVRMRTADSRTRFWGAWSEPVEFGFEDQESNSAYIYILVVLGTLFVALVIGVLCKRSLVMHKLFPPIPQIKDKIRDGQQVNWGSPPLDAERPADKEVVTTVEEFA